MYISMLRLLMDASGSPVLFIGVLLLIMASWTLIVSAIADIAIRLFDRHP
ncbi:MAG: hypothetical protein GXY52_07620 [Chloroflexi bacterium]|nr:hypothetical protein [Chloroflexota bacterium]